MRFRKVKEFDQGHTARKQKRGSGEVGEGLNWHKLSIKGSGGMFYAKLMQILCEMRRQSEGGSGK